MKITNLLVRIKQIEDEIERLRLFDNQIEANYNRVFDYGVTNRIMLDEQCRKIGELKAENKQLKTECALLDDELRIARQDTIDVLNKLKTKAFDKDAFNGWAGSTFVVLVRDIDKIIEDYEK